MLAMAISLGTAGEERIFLGDAFWGSSAQHRFSMEVARFTYFVVNQGLCWGFQRMVSVSFIISS
jgi:hypothetical protein